jgi:hypothetical protein
MNELMPQNNIDYELQRFIKYFLSIEDKKVMDADVKKSCMLNIAKLFAENIDDLDQYNMPEFQVVEIISKQADEYINRFVALVELFSDPRVHKYLLFAVCESFGSFITTIRHADIHFLYARKEEILQRVNHEIELQLMKISRIVPLDVAEAMGRLVRNQGDTGYGYDEKPDISPNDPSDGGICLNPFDSDYWKKIDSIEGIFHKIDPDDYRVLSLNEQ